MTTIRPFETDDLAAAGRLLAARHAAHRRAQPLLSERYEQPKAAEVEIAAALEQENASGAVAVDDGQLTGYLIGAPKSSPAWGPNVWVESAGQAVDDPETMRDLYALAATRWVDEERTAHYILTPSHDPALLDAWHRLGFGHQHAHAIRPVPTSAPTPPASVRIREPRHDDIDVLVRLDLALPEHQGRSPVFSAGTVPTQEESRAEWKEDLDGDIDGYFVAEIQDRVVGTA